MAQVEKVIYANKFHNMQDLHDLKAIWVGKKEKGLFIDKSGGFRNEGINFINFVPPLAFWPPPLAVPEISNSSDCWECKIPDQDVDEAIPADVFLKLMGSLVISFARRYLVNL